MKSLRDIFQRAKAAGTMIRAEFRFVMTEFKMDLRPDAALDLQDRQGRTVLMWSIEIAAFHNTGSDIHVHLKKAEAIIKKCMPAQLNLKDNNGKTALMHAVMRRGQESLVKAIVAKGAALEEKDNNGHTALTYAAIYSAGPIVKLLIDSRADINTHGGGWTPLIAAAVNGRVGNVRLLLDAGATGGMERALYEVLHPIFGSREETDEIAVLLQAKIDEPRLKREQKELAEKKRKEAIYRGVDQDVQTIPGIVFKKKPRSPL